MVCGERREERYTVGHLGGEGNNEMRDSALGRVCDKGRRGNKETSKRRNEDAV